MKEAKGSMSLYFSPLIITQLILVHLWCNVQEVRGEIMDIIRQITVVYPVETFVFGADWLLQRATQTPAADASSKFVQ